MNIRFLKIFVNFLLLTISEVLWEFSNPFLIIGSRFVRTHGLKDLNADFMHTFTNLKDLFREKLHRKGSWHFNNVETFFKSVVKPRKKRILLKKSRNLYHFPVDFFSVKWNKKDIKKQSDIKKLRNLKNGLNFKISLFNINSKHDFFHWTKLTKLWLDNCNQDHRILKSVFSEELFSKGFL